MARLATTRSGSGEPLVLIHGLGSSRTAWDGTRAHLEGSFDVIAVDLPGFGEQPWFEDGSPPTMDSLATAVESELDELGIERPVVVGHSMGGWIALELARRGRARQVIAIGPVGGSTPEEVRRSKRLLRLNRLAAKVIAPVRWTVLRSRLMRTHGFRDATTGEVPYRAAVLSVGHMAACTGFPKLVDDVAGDGGLIELNRTRLGEVECPVLILFGSEDRLIPPSGGSRLAEAIPGAELRTLEGWGHSPILDRPEDVAGMIVERANSEVPR